MRALSLRRLGVTSLVLCLLAPAARAASEQSAGERFARGVRFFSANDFVAALAEFEAAAALEPRPSVLFNLGLTWAALDEPVKAAELLARALEGPSLDERRRQRARQLLDAQLAKTGLLELEVEVADAVVELDNQTVGRAPFAAPLRVKAGKVLVAAYAPRHAPRRLEVAVAAGQTTRVTLALLPLEAAAAELRPAQLKVSSRTPGADLTLAGERAGVTPLASSLRVAPGEVTVRLSRRGYRPEQRVLTLAEGSFTELELDLVEAPEAGEAGELVLDSAQSQLVVTVDGVLRGKYERPLKLPVGPHDVTVERGGYFPIRRRAEVPASGQARLTLAFEPTAETRADVEATAGRHRKLGWAGVLVGAVLGLGSGAYLAYNHAASDGVDRERVGYLQLEATGMSCTNPTSGTTASCRALADDAQRRLTEAQSLRLLGYLGVSLAALAAAAGVFSFLTAPELDGGAPSPELMLGSLRLLISPSQVSVTGRF